MSTRSEEIERRAEELFLPVTEQHGFELVDVEYVKEGENWYLRAYIDKEGGIAVDDCELVSRAVEAELDRQNFIDDSYVLEVSSPGLTRPLKKEKDFARAKGKKIEIHTFARVDGEKQFVGILADWDGKTVTIETEEGGERVFPREGISLIRLAFEF